MFQKAQKVSLPLKIESSLSVTLTRSMLAESVFSDENRLKCFFLEDDDRLVEYPVERNTCLSREQVHLSTKDKSAKAVASIGPQGYNDVVAKCSGFITTGSLSSANLSGRLIVTWLWLNKTS